MSQILSEMKHHSATVPSSCNYPAVAMVKCVPGAVVAGGWFGRWDALAGSRFKRANR
jgi:hypothetical protein